MPGRLGSKRDTFRLGLSRPHEEEGGEECEHNFEVGSVKKSCLHNRRNV